MQEQTLEIFFCISEKAKIFLEIVIPLLKIEYLLVLSVCLQRLSYYTLD